MKEDVFPDAEGWENVDPEEAAKWSVGSEFPHDPVEESQTEGGPLAQRPIAIKRFVFFFMISAANSNLTVKVHLFLSYFRNNWTSKERENLDT